MRSTASIRRHNLFSKLRGKICFKYSRFEEKDLNIQILFGLQNSRIRIRIFEIRGKRFESESNLNIFDHLWSTVDSTVILLLGHAKYYCCHDYEGGGSSLAVLLLW